MGIMTRLQGWALTAVAVLFILVGAYVWGGRASRKAAETKQKYNDALRESAGAKGAHDAQTEVRELPSGSAADELRRDWMRDDDDSKNT